MNLHTEQKNFIMVTSAFYIQFLQVTIKNSTVALLFSILNRGIKFNANKKMRRSGNINFCLSCELMAYLYI